MPELCPLFEVRGLEKRFPGSDRGLFGISTRLSEGEFTVLAGANGSGKTLLVKHLLALEEPSAGAVLFRGSPVKRCLPRLRQSVGMIFQHPEHQLIESEVREDASFGLRFTDLPEVAIQRRTGEVLDLMELTALGEAFTHTLSGGEKRRLALAGALVLEPEMLILDEPFNELDYRGIITLLKHLELLKARGTAVLLITHDLEKVIPLADRILCMDSGRLVLDGPPEELCPRLEEYGVRRPRHPWPG